MRVGVFAGDHAPVESWTGGQPEGLAVDYLRMIAGRAGLRLEFHSFSDWAEVAFEDDRLQDFDVLLAQPYTLERLTRYIPLRPLIYTSPTMISRAGDLRIRRDDDLAQARIVIERRYRRLARILKDRFPEATLVYATDGRDALDMLARGQADAHVTSTFMRARTLLNERATDDLSIVSSVDIPVHPIGPIVRRDLPLLASILRKSEASVSPRELARLRSRWGLDESSLPTSLPGRMSASETQLLKTLPTLRVGYEADRFPYTFSNEQGKLDGLASEYLDVLKERLGLRVELVPISNWTRLQHTVSAGEVDMIIAGSANDFDVDDMLFSQPYDYFPEVIVTRMKGPPVAGPADLNGLQVAARSESGLISRLAALIRDGKIVPVGSNEAGLAMLADGRVDAFVGTLPAIDPLIRNRYPAELRVAGPAGLDREMAIGVTPDYADLLPLLDRTLAEISTRDKQAIRGRWLTAEYRYGVPWGWVIGITLTSTLLLAIFTFAYLRLRRASRAQTAAERALAAQLSFQQALLETIPYPVFVKDAERRYLAVNRAYEQLTGQHRDTLIGRTLQQTRHLHGHDASALHEEEFELIADMRECRRELTLRDADGHTRHLIRWLHAFEQEGRSGMGLLGTVVDISDIRAAEARARASEQRLTDITAAMPMIVFQFRIPLEGQRHFTYVAGDVLGLLGMTAEELMEDEPAMFARVHPEDAVAVVQHLQTSARDLIPVAPYDFRIRVQEGWRWLRTEGGQPHRASDGSVQWSGYWIDTTESHAQAEALRVAKQQAESAASTKAAFLAAMSHEIRTPMAGVLGLIELLSRTPLDRDQTKMLGMADDSAKAMLQILDDILDYSRIESGRLNIANYPFDVRQLVDSVMGLFAARAHEKGLQLHAIQDWRVAIQLMGDPSRMRQILTNLVSNAIKFTEQGSITLSMELVEQRGNAQALRFVIADTGIGISADNLSRLFQPFTQAEQSTSRRFGGTGLGLTISRRLAQMMGGDVRLESEKERGTLAIFEILLETAESAHPQHEFEGKQVWLQCADAMRRAELRNALRSLGFNVVESDDFPADVQGRIALHFTEDEYTAETGRDIPIVKIGESHLTRKRHNNEQVSVGSNPVLWHSVADACRLALGRQMPHLRDTGNPMPAPAWRAHILVAEDHPTNRAVIARQLESLGYDYSLVQDGEQALAALDALQFDLLITDCHMPNLDGYAVARRVRSLEGAGEHLPIIALSASALPEQVRRCIDAGMDDFLAKPVQLAELAEKLGRHLRHTRPVQPTERAGAPTDVPAAPDPLDALDSLVGNRTAALGMLEQLVATTDADLRLISKLPADETIQRRDLLHRMEGALSLAFPELGDTFGDAGTPVSEREARIREYLARLQERCLQEHS